MSATAALMNNDFQRVERLEKAVLELSEKVAGLVKESALFERTRRRQLTALVGDKHVSCVILHVGLAYSVKEEELLGRRRTQHVAWARQVAMFICREVLEHTFEYIGARFGRDHGTAIAGVARVRFELEKSGKSNRARKVLALVEELKDLAV